MKRPFYWLVVAAGAAFALIAGLRLDSQSLAILIGVGCGLAAALPAIGAVLYLWWRERGERRRVQERLVEIEHRPVQAPPVIVLQTSRAAEPLLPSRLLGSPAPREFTVVGEEEDA
ncbi:MAG: hypothetical protein ACP5SI_02695 [Chloroflexia bacterium]